jgi:hypothetical protein
MRFWSLRARRPHPQRRAEMQARALAVRSTDCGIAPPDFGPPPFSQRTIEKLSNYRLDCTAHIGLDYALLENVEKPRF